MTKQEIQDSINELQKQLDKCPEVEPFAHNGEWFISTSGNVIAGTGKDDCLIKSFNYWQTKEIAEKVYALQLRHRKMLSFVSQHQELDEGRCYIYKSGDTWDFSNIQNDIYYPDTIMMTKETADKMLEAIENGSLILEETT